MKLLIYGALGASLLGSEARAQSCPEGKTNVGCAAAEMDAYGCCPVKQEAASSAGAAYTPAAPGWGQRAASGACATGLLASSATAGVCCWPGQAFNGVTCTGAALCPAPYVALGTGCELSSCEQGQYRAGDGLHCCWPGQVFDTQVGDCTGAPQCPAGTELVGNGCQRPVVSVTGQRRDPIASATLGTLVWIPSGGFRMGPPTTAYVDSQPHDVQMTRGFYMMRTEVTQAMFQAVTGDNPAWFDDCGPSCPVEDVDWLEAAAFANQMSAAEGLKAAYSIAGARVSWDESANGYRLPTEAEWEYAARGGAAATVGNGWHKGNSDETTHPVCQLGQNGFGLCDMSGNVWEWCWDWYGSYPTRLVKDPTGPSVGTSRVRRGGAWSEPASMGQYFMRDARNPGGADDELGFRLVRSE